MRLVVYWGGINLAFVEMERAHGARIIYIQHHPKWMSERSVRHEIFHIVRTFMGIYFACFRAERITVFGTNAIRFLFACLLFCRKKTKVVYNEVPTEKNRVVQLIDKLCIKYLDVYVSSEPRRIYFQTNYNKIAKVLENIPFGKIADNMTTEDLGNRIIYAGLISNRRFSVDEQEKIMCWLKTWDYTLDLYGTVQGQPRFLLDENINYHGSVSHDQIERILPEYSYGLVSYYRGDVNYELCAPLKTFDYINKGLRVLSINENKGMIYLSEKYPELFMTLDTFSRERDLNEYKTQRYEFLHDAISSNTAFFLSEPFS